MNEKTNTTKVFWSPAAHGFYMPTVHDTIPDDANEITFEKYTELLTAQKDGMEIKSDTMGYPVLVKPMTRVEDIKEGQLARVRYERGALISKLDGLQSSAIAGGDMDTAKAIEKTKQTLRDMTRIDTTSGGTIEGVRAIYLDAYHTAMHGASAQVEKAFQDIEGI